jgi:hypothetical protein
VGQLDENICYLFKNIDGVDTIAFSELCSDHHGEVGQEQNLPGSHKAVKIANHRDGKCSMGDIFIASAQRLISLFGIIPSLRFSVRKFSPLINADSV